MYIVFFVIVLSCIKLLLSTKHTNIHVRENKPSIGFECCDDIFAQDQLLHTH